MRSGMRNNVLFFSIFVCLLLYDSRVLSIKGKKSVKRSHVSTHKCRCNVTKKSTIERRSSIECETNKPWKKSFVYGKPNYDEVEKHKRGFLANLANLLNDAEMIATGKAQSALTAFTKKDANLNQIQIVFDPKAKNGSDSSGNKTVSDGNNSKISRQRINTKPSTVETEVDSIEKDMDNPEPSVPKASSLDISQNPIITKLIEDQGSKSSSSTRKENVKHTPSPEEVLTLLNETGDFAPIFAMYHGKVVPLGKIPESTFSQKSSNSGISKVDERNSALHFSQTESHKATNDVERPHPAMKDVTGSKRTLFDDGPTKLLETNRMLEESQQDNGLNKLAEYLRNLDDANTLEKQRPQVATGVTKDVVEVPDAEEIRKAALFNHVKGVLLDNGKILNINQGAAIGTMKFNVEESPLKTTGPEEGASSAVVKKKPEDVDSTSRDIVRQTNVQQSAGDVADSQKTVTLTLDALKELLKKSESRASLESLLNKKGEKKNEPAPPVDSEENNSDASKKTDNNASLTALLNTKSEVKFDGRNEKFDEQKENNEEADSNAAKKTDNNVSLAALLNKKPDVKSDTEKDAEEEDPGTIEDFAAGGLKAHNQYRFKHHDEALIWSDDIAAKAQKLAETLADKKTLEIAKDLEKEGYGENVAKVWATFKNAGEAAAKMWYSQNDNYHFDDPHLDENTGQFTQVIWRGTKEMGMGVAKSIDDVNNKYVYVTALYRPPGNVESLLRENVLPTGNNTVDVYTTFFKRTGVSSSGKRKKKNFIETNNAIKRQKINNNKGKKKKVVQSGDLYEGG